MPRRKTHEEFIDELNNTNHNIKILGEYINTHTPIECECRICGNIWNIRPNDLLRGSGCNKCKYDKLRKLFAKSQEDFVKRIKEIDENISVLGEYVNNSTNVLVQCKLCGNTFYLIPNNVFNRKRIPCPVCDDGISYPNKFVRNFLSQLPIKNLIYEWRPTWGKQCLYDNYFMYNNNEYVIEADGVQHFQKNNSSIFKPKEVQKKDKIKDELASNHNIIVIRIDCQKSDANYIKDKILCSQLSSVFDLSHIDWEYCHTQSLNSLIKQACDLYNSKYKIKDICNILQLSNGTIDKYLKIGTELEWCNYINPLHRKVNVYNKITNELIYSFDNVTNCISFLNEKYETDFKRTMIGNVCNGHKRSYKGFIFKYA